MPAQAIEWCVCRVKVMHETTYIEEVATLWRAQQVIFREKLPSHGIMFGEGD